MTNPLIDKYNELYNSKPPEPPKTTDTCGTIPDVLELVLQRILDGF